MEVIVDVTASDIMHGHKCEEASCPIALAILSLLDGDTRVSVSTTAVEFICDYEKYSTTLPDAAKAFINDFDFGRVVMPLSFMLDIPEEVLSNFAIKRFTNG